MSDIVTPPPLEAPFPVVREACDIAAPYVAPKLAARRPDVIFLLASVVSGEAEADFDKGYAINLGGTQALFEAIRREHFLSGGAYRPRLIFTSSIAVFGAPFPDPIGDDFLAAPLTSYGTQKAICELLLGRLFEARVLRWDWPPAADDLRSAGRAEQGGFGVLLGHHPRAALRQGGDPAGQ